MDLRALSLAVTLCVAFVCGCGGGNKQQFAPKTPFPTRDALANVAKAPAPALAANDASPAIAYDVEAPPQPADKTPSSVESVLAVGPRATLTWEPTLRCVAQEVARFYQQNKRLPGSRLGTVIDGVCMAVPSGVSYSISSGTAPAKISDAEVVKAFAGKLEATAPESKTSGAALVRVGDDAVLALAVAPASPTLAVTVNAEGLIVLDGTAKNATAQMLAFVNRGSAEVAPCEPQPGVAPPRFVLRCQMKEGDASAWVDVVSHEPGRVLMMVESRVLARRDSTKAFSYAAPHAETGTGKATTAAGLLAEINRVRGLAKLAPLTLEAKETDTATQLAGHYFDAALKQDGAKTDLICLGLMAGWDVTGGLIKDGSFYSGLVYGSTSAESWVEDSKDAPSARMAILSPRATSIAIGPINAENGAGMGALVATYTFWGDTNHDADATRLYGRIKDKRVSMGLPDISRVPAGKSLNEIIASVAGGNTEPYEGLQTALSNAAYSSGGAVTGWVAAATEIDGIEIPAELLKGDAYQIQIAVTHYRPEGSAWGFYLAYMIKMKSTAMTAENDKTQQHRM